MPQLGETVTEGTITKWYKSEGDRVDRDEPLFEVSTDKVDSEVPSPIAGVLTSILVQEGDTVDVGAKLAVIGDAGAPAGEDAPAGGQDDGADGDTSAPGEDAPAGGQDDGQGRPDTGSSPMPAPEAAPRAAAPSSGPAPEAAAPQPDPAPATGAPEQPASVAAEPRPAVNGSVEGLVLSPVVRKLLNEHGLDPTSVEGTGVGGRITRGDVEGAIADTGTRPAPQSQPGLPAAASVPSVGAAPAVRTAPPTATVDQPVPAATERDVVVPFTNIRRRTAEHMVRSKATSAHTLMVREIDYERVEQVRRSHGEQFRAEEGFGLTYLAFAARAAVDALAEFPHLNSSVGEDSLIVHRDINLGIAVDLDNEGLIVPVVHNAEELNLRGMARRVRDVAERARSKRLNLDDISNGTFSITNAGPFGTLITGAIINQPQVAILSTDGVARKPVVVELPDGTESITIHSVGLVAMSFDHRAVDGAYVARYLSRFAHILDERDWTGEL